MRAGPPEVTRSIRGFDGLVTSSAALTASGWSDPSPGGICTHWKSTPLHGAQFFDRTGTLDVVDGVRSDRLSGLQVTPEFFEVFGVSLNGRAFVAGDRGADTVVLGHDVWRRRFNADATLVGHGPRRRGGQGAWRNFRTRTDARGTA